MIEVDVEPNNDDVLRVEIVHRELATNASLNQLGAQLSDLNSLVFVSTLSTFLDWEELKPGAPRTYDEVLNGAEFAASQFYIARLSYNSPLEVVLAAKKGVGVASDAAGKMIKLALDFEDLRVKHANATNEVLAAKLLTREIRLEERRQKKRIKDIKRTEQEIERAARAITRVQSIHVLL